MKILGGVQDRTGTAGLTLKSSSLTSYVVKVLNVQIRLKVCEGSL